MYKFVVVRNNTVSRVVIGKSVEDVSAQPGETVHLVTHRVRRGDPFITLHPKEKGTVNYQGALKLIGGGVLGALLAKLAYHLFF